MTARREELSPFSDDVNQISRPSGVHARPCVLDHSGVRVFLAPEEVHDRYGAAVVAVDRMVQEGDPLPVRRDARVAHPARGLVEDLADRELEAVAALDPPHGRE